MAVKVREVSQQHWPTMVRTRLTRYGWMDQPQRTDSLNYVARYSHLKAEYIVDSWNGHKWRFEDPVSSKKGPCKLKHRRCIALVQEIIPSELVDTQLG